MRGVEALNKRVMTSGIELGRVVDVILDEAGERPVGFDVLCGDGSHRFLPFPTARLEGEHVEVDSSLLRKPGIHRNSPWCQTELRLNTIGEAQDRYDHWAAIEFDRLHSGPQESWIDEHGKMHERPRPRNPFAQKVSAT